MTLNHPAVRDAARTRYLSPEEVCDLIPGMTKSILARMRFRGEGPRYVRASPKVIVYSEDEIFSWLDGAARQGTAAEAS